MPAPIIEGLGLYLQNQLSVTWWDGEVPRFDVNNQPINPQATGTLPPDWPVVTVKMASAEGAPQWMERVDTFEDPYDDEGRIFITVYGLQRSETEPLMDRIVGLFRSISGWANIVFPPTSESSSNNPYFCISMILLRYTSFAEEGVRYAAGQLAYRCDMEYELKVHGAAAVA